MFNDIFYAYRLGKKGQRPEIFPSSREIITETNRKDRNEVFGWVQIMKG
jgi:hypothetical protein